MGCREPRNKQKVRKLRKWEWSGDRMKWDSNFEGNRFMGRFCCCFRIWTTRAIVSAMWKETV